MIDVFESHRDAVRAMDGRVTPWRLGAEVGRRGEDLPSPYPSGSRAESSYHRGVRYGRIPTTMRRGSVVLPERAR